MRTCTKWSFAVRKSIAAVPDALEILCPEPADVDGLELAALPPPPRSVTLGVPDVVRGVAEKRESVLMPRS